MKIHIAIISVMLASYFGCSNESGEPESSLDMSLSDVKTEGQIADQMPLNDVALGQPVCGDNILQSGEVCDDGNKTGLDGCAADCKSKEFPPPHLNLIYSHGGKTFTLEGDSVRDGHTPTCGEWSTNKITDLIGIDAMLCEPEESRLQLPVPLALGNHDIMKNFGTWSLALCLIIKVADEPLTMEAYCAGGAFNKHVGEEGTVIVEKLTNQDQGAEGSFSGKLFYGGTFRGTQNFVDEASKDKSIDVSGTFQVVRQQ